MAEHVSEPLAHGAVDEEVERVRDGDAAVDEQRGRVARRVAEQIDVERVLDDDEQQQHGQRHFDEQKDADDDDQHHGRPGRRVADADRQAAVRDGGGGGGRGEAGRVRQRRQRLHLVLGGRRVGDGDGLPARRGRRESSARRHLAAALVCGAHGADEAGVEEDERRARDDVDEQHTRPVVDAEVERLVPRNQRRQLVRARRHLDGRRRRPRGVDVRIIQQRRDAHRSERQLAEPADMRRDGRRVDCDDDDDRAAHRAQATSDRRLDRAADVDVPLGGQRRRQPDGRRVEHGRQVVGQREVGEAPRVRHPVEVAPSDRVEVHEARHRADDGQRVGDGERGEQRVRRRSYLHQDGDHQRVVDDRRDGDQRHQEAVDRHRRRVPVQMQQRRDVTRAAAVRPAVAVHRRPNPIQVRQTHQLLPRS